MRLVSRILRSSVSSSPSYVGVIARGLGMIGSPDFITIAGILPLPLTLSLF